MSLPTPPDGRPGPVPGPAVESVAAARPARVRVDSRSLFAGGSELLIAHGGEEYQLRITRQGKLILTK